MKSWAVHRLGGKRGVSPALGDPLGDVGGYVESRGKAGKTSHPSRAYAREVKEINDIDLSGDVWLSEQIISFAPKGQDILRPYLLSEKETHCFSPVDSEKKRHSAQDDNRKTIVVRQPARHQPEAETEANRR